MASRPEYEGLFKVAKQLTLGKCKCGEPIVVDVNVAGEDEPQEEAAAPETLAAPEKVASADSSFTALVKKASFIVEQLDGVADQVEDTNPRLAARIDAVSNEIEKRVARLLQRRQNTK
jgi:hypothetical protein